MEAEGCALAGTDYRPTPLRRRAGRPQLKRDPLGGDRIMARDVPESDWKRFRELRELALERFCKRVFSELEPLLQNVSRTYYERYLDVFHLLKERDRELARAFDDPRRSHMIEQLAAMHASGLVEAGELVLFA